jgi:copper ion binding protein
MTNLTLTVPDIHCDHCASSIQGAVGTIFGVDTVKVDIGGRTVDVAYDEVAVELDAIITAIEGQGYEVVSQS